MTANRRVSSPQDIEFLSKVAAFWKAKDARLEGAQQFGRFVIQRCLGQGAFGVVYLAFDSLLGREVAIKVPGVQSLLDESRIKRFLAEAQHLGSIVHPNIAQVYEANELDGLCFLAMKYYSDGTLADWLRSQAQPIPVEVVLPIFKQIVSGVAAAHTAGIVHRDLKPSNILVEFVRDDESSEARVVPCVADFGLAKNCLDSQLSITTADHTRLGTIGYVAPEQWRNAAMVSATSDVYSLGAILLELLIHERVSPQEPSTQSSIGATEYSGVRLRVESLLDLRPQLPAGLLWICQRCLREDPQERFADANELLAALSTLSNGIELKQTWEHNFSSVALAKRFLNRRAVASVCILSILVSSSAWLLSGKERIESKQDDVRLNANAEIPRERWLRDYALGIRAVSEAMPSDSAKKRTESLDQIFALLPSSFELPFEAKYLRSLPELSRRLPIGFGRTHLVHHLLASPSGSIVALHGPKNDVVLHDLEHNRFVRRLEGLTTQQRRFAFSPDGQRIAASSLGDPSDPNRVLALLVWDVSTGNQIVKLNDIVQAAYVFSLRFINPNQLLVSAHCVDGHRIKIVSIPEGEIVGNFAMEEFLLPGQFFENPVLLYDTMEYRLANALDTQMKKIALIHTEKATKTTSIRLVPSHIGAFSEWNGRLIAYVEANADYHSIPQSETARIDQRLVVWDPKQDKTLFEKELVQSVPITAIALSGNGESVLSIDAASQLRIDKMVEPSVKQVCEVHLPREVWGVDFHRERKQLLSASDFGFVAIHGEEFKEPKAFRLHGEHLVTSVQWRPGFREQFASAGFDKAARVWTLAAKKEPKLLMEFLHPSNVRCLAYSPRGDLLATGCDDGKLRVFSLKLNKLVATIEGHKEKARCVAFSNDGSHLISGGNDNQMICWKLEGTANPSLEPTPSKPICCAVSPTGDRFVFGTEAGMLCIRSFKDSSFRQDLVVSPEQVRSVAISSDGMTIATGSQDGSLCLWNLETGIKLAELAREETPILSLSFSGDNETLSAGLYSGAVVSWDSSGAIQ